MKRWSRPAGWRSVLVLGVALLMAACAPTIGDAQLERLSGFTYRICVDVHNGNDDPTTQVTFWVWADNEPGPAMSPAAVDLRVEDGELLDGPDVLACTSSFRLTTETPPYVMALVAACAIGDDGLLLLGDTESSCAWKTFGTGNPANAPGDRGMPLRGALLEFGDPPAPTAQAELGTAQLLTVG